MPESDDPDADIAATKDRLKHLTGPGMTDAKVEASDDLTKGQARATLLKNTGCLVAGGLAVVLVLALFTVKLLTSDDSCSGAPARHDGITLIACQKPDDSSSSESSSDSSSSSSQAATVAPPAESALPPGQILFQGQSGDNIGFIAQDGLNRFLSLSGPGVTTNGNSVAIAWDKGAGKVVSFGSNLHTTTNNGRYGFAVFRNSFTTPPPPGPNGEAAPQYLAGCAIEVSSTSCKTDTAGAPMFDGDKITIIIGESGHTDAPGDYSADWWFVFQPD